MSYVFKLDEPEVKTFTHYKIASVKIEMTREYLLEPKPGSMEIWIARCNIVNDEVVEIKDEPGIQILFEGEEFEQFMDVNFPVGTFNDIEEVLITFLIQSEQLPAGELVIVA